MSEEERRERAASFGTMADAYERARPAYPLEAARWLAGAAPSDVVDLGAGTGKLTRVLVALGHRVTAVAPLAEMLERLRMAVPEATAVEGAAEAIPLPSESVDVVTAAQAFHWSNHGPALIEIARVLRPGGRIGLVWNVDDESVEWVNEFSDATVGTTDVDKDIVEPIDPSGLFGPVEKPPSTTSRRWTGRHSGSLSPLEATARSSQTTSAHPCCRRSTTFSWPMRVTVSCTCRISPAASARPGCDRAGSLPFRPSCGSEKRPRGCLRSRPADSARRGRDQEPGRDGENGNRLRLGEQARR